MGMNIFFSSDHHFGHGNIIRYCDRPWVKPFYPYEPDVDAMNEALITYWNETVGVNDKVFYLGDFAMGKISETLPIIGKLHGTVQLVPGNHDRCWDGHSKGVASSAVKYVDAGFDTILPTVYDVEEFMVCHFPRTGDSQDTDRYTDFRPGNDGRVLLHGHVHDSWKVNGNQINVGCDVWDYRPVSIDEIRSLTF